MEAVGEQRAHEVSGVEDIRALVHVLYIYRLATVHLRWVPDLFGHSWPQDLYGHYTE